MKPCNILGLEIGWACNLGCLHCYFIRFSELHTTDHPTLSELKRKVDRAIIRGCKGFVLEGQGEPMMYPFVDKIVQYGIEKGLKSLVITNGTIPIEKYEKLYNIGLNHLQISIQQLNEKADIIGDRKDIGLRQNQLLNWLQENKLPFRTNTSIQQLNHRDLDRIVDYLVGKGAFHLSLLTFLPHYHWKDHLKDLAVHPSILREHIEKALEILIDSGKYFTLRYFPFCHLYPKYWKYVTNARFVLFDPWEWEYGHHSEDIEKVWPYAVEMGNCVSVQGEPCCLCLVKEHCGGWNRIYAQGFNGADLQPIKSIPDEYINVINRRGGIFDMNPANSLKGWVC